MTPSYICVYGVHGDKFMICLYVYADITTTVFHDITDQVASTDKRTMQF